MARRAAARLVGVVALYTRHFKKVIHLPTVARVAKRTRWSIYCTSADRRIGDRVARRDGSVLRRRRDG